MARGRPELGRKSYFGHQRNIGQHQEIKPATTTYRVWQMVATIITVNFVPRVDHHMSDHHGMPIVSIDTRQDVAVAILAGTGYSARAGPRRGPADLRVSRRSTDETSTASKWRHSIPCDFHDSAPCAVTGEQALGNYLRFRQGHGAGERIEISRIEVQRQAVPCRFAELGTGAYGIDA